MRKLKILIMFFIKKATCINLINNNNISFTNEKNHSLDLTQDQKIKPLTISKTNTPLDSFIPKSSLFIFFMQISLFVLLLSSFSIFLVFLFDLFVTTPRIKKEEEERKKQE